MSGLELLSAEGLRLDGRKPLELKQIVCKVGIFSEADGSASIEHGNTKAICSVYGPHECVNRAKSVHDKAVVNCEYSMATFSTNYRRSRPTGDRRSTELTIALEKVFEAAIMTSIYPRSQIDIFVQVLQSDGGNLSACINAATLALIDAGIPMKDFVSACTATYANETALVDLNQLEEISNAPTLTLAMQPKLNTVTLFQMDSRLHLDNLESILEAAKKGCKDIFTILQRTIKDTLVHNTAK
ncbi:exosome complex component RRP41-like [Rhopilema esculentum]|uniref:exosome complex component RRP41-like n=1 Tax=Rhopilema esculentum TaxID=499914 RepID=UPI0031CDBE2B